jgi:hypothetical protein
MPQVGDRKFPYTKAGIKAAQAYAKVSGLEVKYSEKDKSLLMKMGMGKEYGYKGGIFTDILKGSGKGGHKYLSKKPDGKGGWNYSYNDPKSGTGKATPALAFGHEEKPMRRGGFKVSSKVLRMWKDHEELGNNPAAHVFKEERARFEATPREDLPKLFGIISGGASAIPDAQDVLARNPKAAFQGWLQNLAKVDPRAANVVRAKPQYAAMYFHVHMERLSGKDMADGVFQRLFETESGHPAQMKTKKAMSPFTNLIKGGGPYIGPRGGRWADAKHTIPWKEEGPKKSIFGRLMAAIKKKKKFFSKSALTAVNKMVDLDKLKELRDSLKASMKSAGPKEPKEKKEPEEKKEAKKRKPSAPKKKGEVSAKQLLAAIEKRIAKLEGKKPIGVPKAAKSEATKRREKHHKAEISKLRAKKGDAALIAGHHAGDGDATKKLQARAQELLPGVRIQESLDVVATAAEHGGKLPKEYVEQMIRENRVAGKKPTSKDAREKLKDMGKKRPGQPDIVAAKKVDKPKGFLTGQSWLSVMETYDKNEDKNYHSENAAMLAEAFGLPKASIDELKALSAKRDKTMDDMQRQGELVQGLWGIAQEKADKEQRSWDAIADAFPSGEKDAPKAEKLTFKITDRFNTAGVDQHQESARIELERQGFKVRPYVERDASGIQRRYLEVEGDPEKIRSASKKIIGGEREEVKPEKKADKEQKPTSEAGGSGAVNAKYLDSLPAEKKSRILTHIADHYGVSVSEIESELTHAEAEDLFEYAATDRAMAMEIYNDFKRRGLLEEDRSVHVSKPKEDAPKAELATGEANFLLSRIAGQGGFSVKANPAKPGNNIQKLLDAGLIHEVGGKWQPKDQAKSHKERLADIHNEGYLASPKLGTGNAEGHAERHAAHEKQHKEMVEAGHLEHLGHGVYADKAPPKATGGKKGKVTIKRGGSEAVEVPATIYGKGNWAITKDPKEGKSRVTNVQAGLGFGGEMSGPQASYVMAHLMEMEGKGELDGFDPNDMHGASSKNAMAAIKKVSDHSREEETRNMPIWTRRGKAKTEARRRGKVADAEKAVADTAGRKASTFNKKATKADHDSVESAHNRASNFEDSGAGRDNLEQSLVADHDGKRYMVSTDGHRMSMIPVSKKVKADQKVYHEAVKGKKTGKVETASAGEEGKGVFPAFERVIPNLTKENTHTFDAESLHAQAHLATTTAGKDNGSVFLFTDEGGVHAQGSHSAAHSPHKDDVARDMHGQRHSAKEEYTGEEKGIHMNPRYLKEALAGAKGAVEVHYEGPNHPIHIQREDGERHVIMPVHHEIPPSHPHKKRTKKSLLLSEMLYGVKKHKLNEKRRAHFSGIVSKRRSTF